MPGRFLGILIVAQRGTALAGDCDCFRHGLCLDEIVVPVLLGETIYGA